MLEALKSINKKALEVKATSNPIKAKRLAGEVLDESNQLLGQLITHSLENEKQIKLLNDEVTQLKGRLTKLGG